MSVLIKGINKPKNCFICRFKNLEICYEDCPLIEVPTPHGRLIDADELERQFTEAAEYYYSKARKLYEEKGEGSIDAIRANRSFAALSDSALRVASQKTIIDDESGIGHTIFEWLKQETET